MRVFLPHRENKSNNNNNNNNNNSSSGNASSSPREDPKRRKQQQTEEVDERKVAAKKQRVVVKQHSSASSSSTASFTTNSEVDLKDPSPAMGGGGKLYPVRKERELLEVKKRSSGDDPRNSDAASAAVAASVNNRTREDTGSDLMAHAAVAAAARQNPNTLRNNINSKAQVPSSEKRGSNQQLREGNYKSEYDNDNGAISKDPAQEDHFDPDGEGSRKTISISQNWDSAAACASPFASSSTSANYATRSNLYARSSVAAAGSSSLGAAKSTDHDDPATISKDDTNNDNMSLPQFAHLLRTAHTPSLEINPMQGDGNCLFRAISLQVYGSEDMHENVRSQCLDFMEMEQTHFQDFVAEPYADYIQRKRCDGVHGNHAEIQAMSELYNRRIEVYVPPKLEPMNIFQQEEEKNEPSTDDAKSDNSPAASINPPIRLLYMDGNHYDALIDPLLPTAGLGLGLPGLQPGLADKLQLDQAKRESNQIIQTNMDRKMQLAMEESKRIQNEKEEGDIRRVMEESCVGVVGGNGLGARTEREEVEDAFQKKALYLSEIDAADFDLEQAVLASSLESYRKAEQERKQPSSSSGRRSDNAGRRGRYNSSPSYNISRSQRSGSNSPVYRTTTATSSAAEPSYSAGFSSSPTHYGSSYPYSAAATSAASAAAASSVASFPRARSSSPPDTNSDSNYYSYGPAAASASIHTSSDEYPSSVQELVMNGFQLSKVLHAYELIGDNFDDLLSFLLSSTS